jgi:HEPN domain-containing protein
LAKEGGLEGIVLFHAQQCSEKALKAALVSRGMSSIRTHDLGLLLDQLALADASWDEIRGYCEDLSDFAVAPRYPGWEIVVAGVDQNEAVSQASAILRTVRRALNRVG